MSFHTAYVSLIQEKPKNTIEPVTSLPTLTVHAILSQSDEEAARYHLTAIAENVLRGKYGDEFIGLIDDEKDLPEKKAGNVVLIATPNTAFVNLWFIGERVEKGWISKCVAVNPIKLGYFTFVKVDVVLPEICEKLDTANKYIADHADEKQRLENQIQSLTDHIKLCERESENLRAAIVETRKTCATRTDDCRRLLNEVNQLRKTSDADLTCIQELHNEIHILKKRLADQTREISNLREDAVYAVRSGSTPSKKTEGLVNPAYEGVIVSIKNFDKNTLRSRRDRDRLLIKRGVKNIREDSQTN